MPGRDSPDPTDVLKVAIDAVLSRRQRSFPAIVTSVEGADNRVTVQPALRIRNRGGADVTPRPVTVPVEWPSFGDLVVQGSLAPGDEVVVECMDRNWLAWLTTGGVVDQTAPGGARAGYAVARPAQLSTPRRPGLLTPGVALRVGRKDGLTTLEIRSDGSIRLAATDVTLTTGSGLSDFLTQLQAGIAAWVPVPNNGGAELKTALTAWLALPPPTGGPPPP